MKSIFLKSLFVINIFLMYNCNAQHASVNEYIAFYNGVVPKLNSVAANKTQFYGHNFSEFYNELLSKNVSIVNLGYGGKTDTGIKYYKLRLFFCDSNMDKPALDNKFQIPWITITFQDEIPSQIKSMVLQYHGEWNNTFVQFFSNMKIESIEFIGVNGYNSNDWSGK
ncbi:hypothetical protein REB14_12500 [Chryseobacterium sp. ES2]|uniref:Uncharacterized protein n=2 Tax=Chryseobacterium TaxID=59732 RepID=A0ABU1E5I1_9FLAO|nr:MULTISPECIES: hypothetical protein [Chryseobacterium]MDR4952995.1 hypothetical protein [Chryseobacterium sp. ES2]MDR6460903.1 hypothetical protein [Chryseobacterium vietnamense]